MQAEFCEDLGVGFGVYRSKTKWKLCKVYFLSPLPSQRASPCRCIQGDTQDCCCGLLELSSAPASCFLAKGLGTSGVLGLGAQTD